MPSFTHLQGQYLAFLDAYTKVNGRPPSEADFQRYFKVTPPAIHQMILTLIASDSSRGRPAKRGLYG